MRIIREKIPHILFFSIILLGFLLRAQETLSGNFLFLLDQGRDMLGVKGIIFDHHLTLLGPYTSLGGVFQGPLWYYLISIPTFITNGDPWGPEALMLILSVSLLVIVFSFTKKYFGIIPALLATYLFAISPEAISAATFSWNPHPMWLVITLYIFVLYQTVVVNKKYHFILWPLIALGFHFETAFGVFLVISTLLYFLIFKRKLLKTSEFVYGLLLSLLLFLPQAIFEIRHNFLMTRSIIKVFEGSNQGLFAGGENKGIYNLFMDHLSTFYNNFASSFPHDNFLLLLPTLILVFIVVSLIFMAKLKLLKSNEKQFIYGNLTIVTIIIVLSFIYPFPVRSWFLTGFQSFYLVIVGFLFAKLVKYNLGKIVIAGFVIATLIFSTHRIDLLYFHPPDNGGVAKIKGKEAAIDYIYRDAKGKPFGLFVFSPPVNTDPYDYLIWWYGKNKYSYLPYKEKKGTFYLLIEPDSGAPWSYKGWLETVIIKGKVISTKTLPSGFIIQKRYANN